MGTQIDAVKETFPSFSSDFGIGLPKLQGYLEQCGLEIFSRNLHRYLQTHNSAYIVGWSVNVDEDRKYVWLTSPYGLDVCFCNNTYENCEFICETIVNKENQHILNGLKRRQ